MYCNDNDNRFNKSINSEKIVKNVNDVRFYKEYWKNDEILKYKSFDVGKDHLYYIYDAAILFDYYVVGRNGTYEEEFVYLLECCINSDLYGISLIGNFKSHNVEYVKEQDNYITLLKLEEDLKVNFTEGLDKLLQHLREKADIYVREFNIFHNNKLRGEVSYLFSRKNPTNSYPLVTIIWDMIRCCYDDSILSFFKTDFITYRPDVTIDIYEKTKKYKNRLLNFPIMTLGLSPEVEETAYRVQLGLTNTSSLSTKSYAYLRDALKMSNRTFIIKENFDKWKLHVKEFIKNVIPVAILISTKINPHIEMEWDLYEMYNKIKNDNLTEYIFEIIPVIQNVHKSVGMTIFA